jgi:hypothetical protein
MINEIIIGVLCFLIGYLIGYNVCRSYLHSIAITEIGAYKTSKLFGYPPINEKDYCPCGCGLKMGVITKQVPEKTFSEEQEENKMKS